MPVERLRKEYTSTLEHTQQFVLEGGSSQEKNTTKGGGEKETGNTTIINPPDR